MSKVKRASTLSGLVDSDVEDMMFHELPTPDSAAENRAPAKKTRGRPKVAPSKVTKTKAPARRTSGRVTATAKATNVAPAKGRRKALADKTNRQDDGETEDVDDFEEDLLMEDAEVEEPVLAKQATTKPAKKAAVPRRNAAKGIRTSVDDSQAVPQPVPRAKKGRPARKEITEEPSPEKVIQETQQDAMDLDGEADEELEESVIEQSVARIAHNSRQTSHSRPRQQFIPRQRAGSASDTERGDPNLRRKLGEMTKKYENLQLKHQDLREIGLKEAERNYETLRRQSEDKTKKYNDLIASMKTDLVTQTSLAKESRGLKKKIETQASELAALQLQVEEMTASLNEAQAQNKTLSAKLAANRTVAASVESANAPKIPGSAMKAGIRMIGSAEAAQAAQHAQLKEDLYSDLTGLLVRSVDRKTEEDVFDCLQTGRNGTLHFKLAAANEKSSESYDDAQCNYVPQLDPSRDKALMELLPDYLVDEITFPRQHAAKFYARVVKALTEKPA